MHKDKVTPEVRQHVLLRDGQCFLHRYYGDSHVCHGQYGQSHSSYDLAKLTLDHVHMQPGGVRGKRASSDEQHLTVLCWQSNVSGVSRIEREAQREYLRTLYPGNLENKL